MALNAQQQAVANYIIDNTRAVKTLEDEIISSLTLTSLAGGYWSGVFVIKDTVTLDERNGEFSVHESQLAGY